MSLLTARPLIMSEHLVIQLLKYVERNPTNGGVPCALQGQRGAAGSQPTDQ
jgi:hypothetical protein